MPNLQSILLNKTPFVKHLATLIDPTLKLNQVVGIQGNNNNDNDVNDYPNLNEKIYTRRILSCLKSVTDQYVSMCVCASILCILLFHFDHFPYTLCCDFSSD